MSPESFDVLITDRELGELPPETLELLEAYLALHPKAEAEGADVMETIAVARRAVVMPPEIPRSELVVNRLRQERARWGMRRRLTAVARVAAGVALGLGIGWLWFARSITTSSTSVAAVAVHQSPTTGNEASTFWRRNNFTVAAAETSSGREPRVHWSSPVKKPRLEENQ